MKKTIILAPPGLGKTVAVEESEKDPTHPLHNRIFDADMAWCEFVHRLALHKCPEHKDIILFPFVLSPPSILRGPFDDLFELDRTPESKIFLYPSADRTDEILDILVARDKTNWSWAEDIARDIKPLAEFMEKTEFQSIKKVMLPKGKFVGHFLNQSKDSADGCCLSVFGLR
ncbi:MAG: hypothetical protein FWC00_05120 [Firmicutes bacterium]|nr:hypothetical protein [Bacillota bacterium]